jgi:hypothetical protein
MCAPKRRGLSSRPAAVASISNRAAAAPAAGGGDSGAPSGRTKASSTHARAPEGPKSWIPNERLEAFAGTSSTADRARNVSLLTSGSKWLAIFSGV